MDYFRLEQDKRLPFNIWIRRVMMLEGIHTAMRNDYSGLKDMNAVEVTGDSYGEYPDVFDKQLFLIKGGVKDSFDLHIPHISYKEFFLIDKTHKSYERYYAPVLPVIESLSEQSECSADKSVVARAVLRKNCLPEESIFQVGGVADRVIIVRLDAAESILRRSPKGTHLSHVDLSEE